MSQNNKESLEKYAEINSQMAIQLRNALIHVNEAKFQLLQKEREARKLKVTLDQLKQEKAKKDETINIIRSSMVEFTQRHVVDYQRFLNIMIQPTGAIAKSVRGAAAESSNSGSNGSRDDAVHSFRSTINEKNVTCRRGKKP